ARTSDDSPDRPRAGFRHAENRTAPWTTPDARRRRHWLLYWIHSCSLGGKHRPPSSKTLVLLENDVNRGNGKYGARLSPAAACSSLDALSNYSTPSNFAAAAGRETRAPRQTDPQSTGPQYWNNRALPRSRVGRGP